jgi:excinuclease ABC subunit B
MFGSGRHGGDLAGLLKDTAIRVEYFGDEIERLSEINVVTGAPSGVGSICPSFPPPLHHPKEKMDAAIQEIYRELEERVAFFEERNMRLEAQRIKQRTLYDIEMMQELGYCSASRTTPAHRRGPWAPPPCADGLLPDDFLMFTTRATSPCPGSGYV